MLSSSFHNHTKQRRKRPAIINCHYRSSSNQPKSSHHPRSQMKVLIVVRRPSLCALFCCLWEHPFKGLWPGAASSCLVWACPDLSHPAAALASCGSARAVPVLLCSRCPGSALTCLGVPPCAPPQCVVDISLNWLAVRGSSEKVGRCPSVCRVESSSRCFFIYP